MIAFGIFIYGWNARKYIENSFILFLGVGYLFVGALDFLHFLAYQGMGVFSQADPNLSTQLWMAARYLESLTLLTSLLFIKKYASPHVLLAGFAILTAIIIGSIFYWQTFPVCYVADVGLTSFKKISEYAVCVIFLISLYILHKKRDELDNQVHKYICWSLILTVMAELAFAQYMHVYGITNTAGHFLKIMSYYLIYKAIVFTGIIRPLDLIFLELKKKDLQLKEDLSTIMALEKDRGIVLSMLVHDMKTPLISIKGFSSLLLKKPELLVNSKSREYVDVIYRQSENLEKLVHDFLISSRSGHGNLALNIDQCNLQDLLKEIIENYLNQCKDTGLQIEPSIQQTSLTVPIDRSRFHRAISNLLDNAMRFSPPNGTIFLKLNVGEKEFTLEIQDQGPGIPDNDLMEIFKPFYRGAAQKDSNGYGLGLAGVKTIVESHGGVVRAGNTESGGAVFIIVMPLEGSAPHQTNL